MAPIQTTHGDLDESLLTKREGVTSAGAWVEYYLDGVLVHRSVTVSLQGMPAFGTAGTFERYGHRWTFEQPCR
jgi:hypothetical protein